MSSRKRHKPEPTHGGARKGAGRKTYAELGLVAKTARVMVRFTPDELARLERDAEREGISVSELVSRRALRAPLRRLVVES